MGLVREIEQRQGRSFDVRMLQTVLHPVKVRAPVAEGLFDRLLDLAGRILLVESQDTHKVFDASPIRPLLAQEA
jgi:hypothetical protein